MHPLHRYDRPVDNYRQASYSPIGRRTAYNDHDQHTLKDQYVNRREVSQDNMTNNKVHYFNAHDTPYLNGKKNKGFDNPSLRSSNIFFDYNYGYVNDMPNDRLLTPVKHDRYSKGSPANERSTVDNRDALTPTKFDRREQEDDRGRAKDLDRRRLQDQYNQDTDAKKERRPSDLNNANNDQGRRVSGRDQAVSQPPPSRKQTREEEPNQGFQIQARDVPKYERHDDDFHRKKKHDDDAISQVTVVSNLSSPPDYKCHKCLNKCVHNEKEAQKRFEKQVDKETQRINNQINARAAELENEREWMERQKRMNVSRQQKQEIDNNYYDKLERRRSPSKETDDQAFKQIFDKQDEVRYRQRLHGLDYRHDLKDQIMQKEADKRYQRELDQRPASASLLLTDDFYFKRNVEDKNVVLATLQDQVAYKKRKQLEDREDDKIEAIMRTEEVRRAEEEERRRAKDKDMKQKREMRNAFWDAEDEKKNKQKDQNMRKAAEKFMVDNQYNEFKRREYDNQVKVRRQYQDFLAGCINQERPSYKKLYEDRKQHKEATSINVKRTQQKKVYPCGDCNTLYEKRYLTKNT